MVRLGGVSAIEWSKVDIDIPSINQVNGPSINHVNGLTVSVESKVRKVREGEQVAWKGSKNATRKWDVMNQDFCNNI